MTPAVRKAIEALRKIIQKATVYGEELPGIEELAEEALAGLEAEAAQETTPYMTRDKLAQRLDELVGWLRFNRVSICGLEAGDIAAKAAAELRRPAAAEVETLISRYEQLSLGELGVYSSVDRQLFQDTAALLRRLSPSPIPHRSPPRAAITPHG